MHVTLQNRVRDLIDDLVHLAESSSQRELETLVTDAVKTSGSSDRDVALAFSTLLTGLQEHLNRSRPPGDLVVCSFYQKSQRDVKTIVQGPTAAIFNECVAICEETISSRQGLLQRIFGARR